MKTLMGKTALGFMMGAMLTACGGGGTSEPLPTDATVVVDESVAAASDALTESAASVANAAEGMAGESWNVLQDNWQDSIGTVKDRWAELSEEDLLLVNGDRDQLVSLVQEKYGLDRDSAELEVDDWAAAF